MKSTLVFAAVLSITPTVGAQTFFSVDIEADTLVRIDSVTGGVTVVGPLEYDAVRIALTTLQGKLYAINYRSASTDIDLIEINTSTGAATFLADPAQGAAPVTAAEGLTVRDGQLILSYTTVAAEGSDSHNLGVLDLAGNVTFLGDALVDMDASATDPSGRIYANNWTGSESELYRVDPTELIGSVAGGYDDMTFAGDELWAILAETRLLRLDTSTGSVLETVLLDPAGPYRGLALECGGSTCPEDIDGDGQVGITDLLAILAAWGSCDGK